MLRVHTDEGIVGLGETSPQGGMEVATLHGPIADPALDRDPRVVRATHDDLETDFDDDGHGGGSSSRTTRAATTGPTLANDQSRIHSPPGGSTVITSAPTSPSIWVPIGPWPALRRSEGAVVNVTSMAAERGIEGLSTYSATKGGLTSLTRQLAVAYAADGVRVNAVAPGTIETPLNEEARKAEPGWVEERRAQVPLGRLGDPADVADPAVFLASDAARYVTGHVLVVDGGVLASA